MRKEKRNDLHPFSNISSQHHQHISHFKIYQIGGKEMNDEIIKHAEAIAEILRKEYNPHVRVEVEAYGLKMVSDEWFEPIIVDED